MRLSIILPTLDEARAIVGTLAPLQPLRAAGHEVIVVDGGSRDATRALAAPLADRVLDGAPSRARQMNAGAAAAHGDVLLFLHADTLLPEAAAAALVRTFPPSGRRWGRFDVAIDGRPRVLRAVAWLMNRRSRLTGIATGDQAMFVDRATFHAVGGFPDQPLMEDVELSARLKRSAGSPLALTEAVVTSGRRWEAQGPWRTIVAMWRLRHAYWRGADPADLARRYGDVRVPPDDRVRPTLQVFAKAPVPGTVKTRLGAAIGAEGAATVHAELVERTLATAAAARAAGIVGRVELWCAPDASAPAFAAWRDRYDVVLAPQPGGDLGARMHAALHAALASGGPALLIGTDCPTLDPGYLARAAAALDRHDAVIGPAEDGGYVLIGLARPLDVFTGIDWGTPAVLAATRARLSAAAATWDELPVKWDVDEPADLARWRVLAAPVAGSAIRVPSVAG
jgi:rSAM/selenodomain-associated transferase 2/rSAM/selenodomain-associated transferase 1